MDPYINEWLNLLFRFAHLVTGIAWIGASFYFVWLDNHLQTPPQWKSDRGIKGDLWAIHGGGFYEVAKYQLAPPSIPPTLHWFKWEAYTSWLTGFLLLTLMYYVGAEAYLIDKNVADISQWQAIGIGLGAIVGGFVCYELMVRTRLKNHSLLLGLLLVLLATALSYGLTQVFSARGAYIHIGAIIGSIMAGNVFFGIIPSQKALVAAVEKGEAPDPAYGVNAKLRSTHNTYITLPILFIMISNHYPITYNHSYNWLVLVAMIMITAAVRQYFVLRHFGKQKPLILVGAALALVVLAYAIAPQKKQLSESEQQQAVDIGKVAQIIQSRCATCHSSTPSDEIFSVAPAGVMFDDMTTISRWASRIKARSVDSSDMPLMNKTAMTQAERDYLALWYAKGAPVR
jgi:uncharacterized membrane protein